MKAIEKAIWYIENHYREQISLDSIAAVAGVSRYHLSRIFCYAVGQPINRYIRLRRLSTAAIALASGEDDILSLALSVGYGSHEAFTRAFKDHFSITPEQVRSVGHTNQLTLTEAVIMNPGATKPLEEPTIERLGEITIVGTSRHYTFDKVAEIPDQWQSFTPLIPGIAGHIEPTTYGIIYGAEDECFDYMSGVAWPKGMHPPGNMVSITLAPQAYLVFQHRAHVSALRSTCHVIWSDWLPASDHNVVEAPWFERYGLAFDPVAGTGGLEIFIPIAGR